MNLAGIFAPIPTPFDDRDRVDTGRLKAALAQLGDDVRSTGFVVLGSNGEAALMDDFESRPGDRRRARGDAARPAFIVGTGRESTQAAIKATQARGRAWRRRRAGPHAGFLQERR